MRLYAVIYTPDTTSSDIPSLNGLAKAKSRIDALTTAVQDSWIAAQKKFQANPVTAYQTVFLAPEYFFSNQRQVNDRFFSHDVKRYILSELTALAKKHPKMLIIPGTVLWTKSATQTNFVTTPRFPKGINVTKLETTRVNKVLQRIQGAHDQTDVTSEDWAYKGTDPTVTTPQGYLAHPRFHTRIAQNVAYVLLGNEALKYHKMGNYEEVKGEAGNIVFAPGNIVGRFDVGGVRYGLEICMDYAQGVFESTVATQGAAHVRIIVSSYVSAKVVPNTAIAIHASTMAQQTFVDGGKSDTTGTNQIRFTPNAGAKLFAPPTRTNDWTLWQIDLDEGKLGITNPHDLHFRNTALQPLTHAY